MAGHETAPMDEERPTLGEEAPTETVAYLTDPEASRFECAEEVRSELGDQPDTRVLVFSVTESAEQLDHTWDQYVGEAVTPERVVLLLASHSPSQGDHVSAEADSGTPVDIMYVNPKDLTGVAMAFSRVLEAWGEEPIVVCLRELDLLTRYHDPDTVFQFVNSLIRTLRESNTHIHAHIRPETMDEVESNALVSLFNRTVDTRE